MTHTPTRLLLLLAAALSGCSLAPTYQRPAAPVAGDYPAGAASAPAAGAANVADISWRSYFTDARLQQLIAAALENNRDLRNASRRRAPPIASSAPTACRPSTPP
jgi:multidrug efflux system outer membrane protein